MAATLTITSPFSEMGPTRGPSGKIRETLKIVGSSSAANDTGTVVPAFVHKNAIALDSGITVSESVTIGGDTLTITALNAIGSSVVYVEIEGDF